jgi:eukaryotic-like serine/threonine-protein kinase
MEQRQVERLFHEALQRMPAQREAWLTEVCAGDEALLREVTRLVASHELPTIDASTAATSAQPNDEAVRLQPGHRLGPYEIVSFLAAGGMGAVYRASESLSY